MERKLYLTEKPTLVHKTIADMIVPGSLVLEMGCAAGTHTRLLKEYLGCRVTGLEIEPTMAAQAEHHAEQVIVGSLESPATWDQIEGKFPYIIFADVLEHLSNPSEILLRARGFLEDGGCIISSIPNVAYYKIRKQLLLGKFEYSRFGIMDDTHLRFFTAKTAKQLFTDAGYMVEKFVYIFWSTRDRLLGRWFPNACAHQFIIKAVPVERD